MKTMIVRKRKKRTVTDREKFDAWMALCPVTVLETINFAYGYTEVHIRCQDEKDDAEDDE